MNKLTRSLVLALLWPANSVAAEPASQVMTLTVGKAVYSIPEDFLGQVVPHPEQSQGILEIHVRYPDLAPVGNTSGKCPRKVALTDDKCPYFSIFLIPDDEHLPAEYDGYFRRYDLRSQGIEAGFEIFSCALGKVFKWTDNGVARAFTCDDLTCGTWGRTKHGGAYRVVFSSSWWRDGKQLSEDSAALVDTFREAARSPK
jgi:hypothetical protein